MGSAWFILSTRWDLSTCQAALNVVISVVGTVGIWTFGRFFWQRACAQVINDEKQSHVKLPKLLTIASPGESWDLVLVQRRKVFSRENWHLLLQVVVITIVSVALMLAGPIAKVSLRTGRSKFPRDIDVLQTMKGGGYFGNLLDANVLWNTTMKSLENAQFPTTQMLDYLPASTEPWVYSATDWDPTWVVTCNNTPMTPLEDVLGNGLANMYHPLTAFPKLREIYTDQRWLSESYRQESNFDAWFNWNLDKQFERVFFFVIIQSDPMVDNRTFTNQGTLEISISCFDATNFTVNTPDEQNSGEDFWMPIGLVDRVTYTRTDCAISRNPHKTVSDEDMVPWIWTNNTYSIAMGYRTFWQYALEETVGRDMEPRVLDSATLFRYYQAYMVNMNTNHALPMKRKVTIWVDTVELSVVFLTLVLLVALATVISSLRYCIFRIRKRKALDAICVPDGKLGWMIHAAKAAEEDVESGEPKKKDREYLRDATFGRVWLHEPAEAPSQGIEDDRATDEKTEPQDLSPRRVQTNASNIPDIPKSRRIARVRSVRASVTDRSLRVSSELDTHSRKDSRSTGNNDAKRLSSVAER